MSVEREDQLTSERSDIRLALPSKGKLTEGALDLLEQSGLRVHKPNPRQYEATIPGLPGVHVLFQRAGDIVVSIRNGSVDFGITGWDMVAEQASNNGDGGRILNLLDDLQFGHCTLNAIVPADWETVRSVEDLAAVQRSLGRPLRIATKFPRLTGEFFAGNGFGDAELIAAEGTLEIAPRIGYADMIVDLVSTGTTLRENGLRALDDGQILSSQACLIANRARLKNCPQTLAIARQLLELIVANERASENVAIFANMRGESPEIVAERIFSQQVIGGLQGPTISPIIARDGGSWHAVNIIVRKDQLTRAIGELRAIGGSGVIVTPVSFIFEEEPPAYRRMLDELED